MTAEPNVVGQIPLATEPPTTAATAAPATDAGADKPKIKLAKSLPSDRMSFDKSILVLRCYAIGSGPEGKPVSNGTLGELAKLATTTAGVNNMFFADAGLITKAGLGYTPSPEVVNYERAYQFNADTAGQKLAPALRRSWFGQRVLPALLVGPRAEEWILGEWAEVTRAQSEHKPQLRMILDYLVFAAVVEREGGMIRAGKQARDDGQTMRAEEQPVAQPQVGVLTPPTPASTPTVQTTFSGGAMGGLNLSVNISVDMMQMATWPPQTVQAFMAGLAQVITAKAAAEGSAAR